ncbi:MAG: PAS domain S-box protein, partial [Burkholderiaceae bacterium]|nr:PAS domain S-box protein [Burkholderiaceae bacterium]
MDNLPQHSGVDAQLLQLRRRLAAQRAINEATERALGQAEALRIAAEARLARSEERNSKLGGMASDWTWETDVEHRLVFVSEYDRELPETPPVIGQARWDQPDVQGLPNDWEAHRRVLDAHLLFRDFQCCGRDTTGKLCWSSLNGDPVFDDCGKFSGYIGIGIDITARRGAEERAARLTRMYAVLSAVNEAVARAADELELFEATCAALYDKGKFEVVAIHQLDQTRLELVPTAARGLDLERLNTHAIGADGELPDDRSILVRAFVQGRKCYTPDYLADPRLRAHWDRARGQGIASMLSVPLHRHGETCAVLSIASGQTHRFDEVLIELADRVADGISLALDSISANRERLIAQEQLAISEERFRRLTGLSSDWHWESDAQGRISMLSESYRQNIDIDPRTRIGLEAWTSEPAAYEPGTYPGFAQALAERRRFLNVEFHRNDFADGVPRWRALSGEPVFDAAGSFIGYRGTGRDVTDKHQVEEQLRASEERFRRLNELSSDWIWERDENLRITYLSDSYYVLTGATPEQMLGTTLESFAHDEIEALETALQARRPFRDLEFARVDPDGELRWRSLAGELIIDENGAFRGYRGTGKDITERKRHEAELLRRATT